MIQNIYIKIKFIVFSLFLTLTVFLQAQVPDVNLPALGITVMDYWQTHPYNPSNWDGPDGPVIESPGLNGNPGNVVVVPSGGNIQTAITDNHDATYGVTVILKAGGTYDGYFIQGLDNVHIMCTNYDTNLDNRPVITGVQWVLADPMVYDYSDYDAKLDGSDPVTDSYGAWAVMRRMRTNFFFKNIKYQAPGTSTAIYKRVANMLHINCSFKTQYPDYSHHVASVYSHMGANNLAFMGCQFEGSSEHPIYFDGVHNTTIYDCTFNMAPHASPGSTDGGYDSGPVFLCNDDFTEAEVNLPYDHIDRHEERTTKYSCLVSNQYINGGGLALLSVTGRAILLLGNEAVAGSWNSAVNWDSRTGSSKALVDPDHHYSFDDMWLVGNRLDNISEDKFLHVNHISQNPEYINEGDSLSYMGKFFVTGNIVGDPYDDFSWAKWSVPGEAEAWSYYDGPGLVAGNCFNNDTTNDSLAYTNIVCAKPRMLPESGSFYDNVSLTFTTATSNAQIRYTTDGSTPTTSSALWPADGHSNFSTIGTTTITARTFKDGSVASIPWTRTYTLFDSGEPELPAPTFDPHNISVWDSNGTTNISVTISCEVTGGADTIYYTLDGSEPTTASSVYSAPINISSTTTIKAFADKVGYSDSVMSETTIEIMRPAGVFNGGFESGTDNWTDPGSAGAVVSDPYNGTYSLRANETPNPPGLKYIQQDTLGLNDNSQYTMRFYAKGTGTFNTHPDRTSETPGLLLRLIIWDDRGQTIEYSERITNQYAAYQEITFDFVTGANVTGSRLDIYWEWSGDGLVTVDDIELLPIDESPSETVATPVFSPAGGTHQDSVTVTVTTATIGAEIRYTTDGSTPTTNTGTLISSGDTINLTGPTNMILNAIAYKSGYVESSINSIAFNVEGTSASDVLSPTITPAGGTFTNSVLITMSENTPGSTIRYTLDGTQPSLVNGSDYPAGGFTISEISSFVVKTRAYKEGMNPSPVYSEGFSVIADTTPTVSTPTIDPDGGSFTSSAEITLDCDTADVDIYYTTNGEHPASNGVLYSGSFTLNIGTTTVRVVAMRSGYYDSAVGEAIFNITDPGLPTVGTPTITPDPLDANNPEHRGNVQFTIDCPTNGVTLYYTTDGSTPNTSSPSGAAPITVTLPAGSQTIKVLATLAGHNDSVVLVKDLTIPSFNYFLNADFENGSGDHPSDWSDPGSCVWDNTDSVDGGYSFRSDGVTSFKYAQQNLSIMGGEEYLLSYWLKTEQPVKPGGGSILRWVKLEGTGDSWNGIWTSGTNGWHRLELTVTPNADVTNGRFDIGWDNTEGNAWIDCVYFGKTDGFVAMPDIQPKGGTFSSSVSVTLDSDTSGAMVFYTTNGNEPTTNDLLYTGSPVALSSVGTYTVKAAAYTNGLKSFTAENVFTISIPLTANAGSDITVNDTNHDGIESVQLNGSVLPDNGNVTNYSWSTNGTQFATNASATVDLPVGTNTVLFRVSDNLGDSDSDEIMIIVNTNESPVANALNFSVRDKDDNGSEPVTFDGSPSTDDGSITNYSWSTNGTEFARGISPTTNFSVGSYLISLRVVDNAGFSDTHELTLEVKAAGDYSIAGVPHIVIDEAQDIESYWASLPYNPESVNYDPVIPSPEYTNNVADFSNDIQSAIDDLPAEGGTVYVPNGVYTNNFGIIERDNVHIVGESREGVIFRMLPWDANDSTTFHYDDHHMIFVAAHPTAIDYGTYDARTSLGKVNWQQEEWDSLVNKISNIAFRNITFDGNGVTPGAINFNASQDILIENCVFKNLIESPGYHEPAITTHSQVDNLIVRNNIFYEHSGSGGTSADLVYYNDGVHGAYLIDNDFYGATIFLCNDDYTEDLNENGSTDWKEERNSKYVVIYNNRYLKNNVNTPISYTGEKLLVYKNYFPVSIDKILTLQTRWSHQDPSLVYEFYGTRVVSNQVKNAATTLVSIENNANPADYPYQDPLIGYIEIRENYIGNTPTYSEYNIPDGPVDTNTITATNNDLAQTWPPVFVNQYPTIKLDSPIEGATYNYHENITLEVTASDSDGSITNVVFYSNFHVIDSVSSEPYALTISNLGSGDVSFYAYVFDDDGDSAFSSTVTVTVLPEGKLQASADAGSDLIVVDTDQDEFEEIDLDGSASLANGDGDTITNYAWYTNGIFFTNSVDSIIPVNMPIGSYIVTLTVYDSEGTSASDTINLSINRTGIPAVGNLLSNASLETISGSWPEYWSEKSADAFVTNDSYDGSNSLCFTQGNSYFQQDIILETNKQYTLSAMVKATISDSESAVFFRYVQLEGNSSVHFSGDIDGTDLPNAIWKKIDHTFTTSSEIFSNGRLDVGYRIAGEDIGESSIIFDNFWLVEGTFPESDAGTNITVNDDDDSGYESITLDGRGSTANGGTITNYSWTTNGVEFATESNPTITFPVGTYTVRLTVIDDDSGAPSIDTVIVTVNGTTQSPTANAGTDITVYDYAADGSESVTLDGSASTKGTGDITNYSWTMNDGSSDIVIATGTNQTVTLPTGTNTVMLTVYDENGFTDTNAVTVAVLTPTAPTAYAGGDMTNRDADNDGFASVNFDGSDSLKGSGNITNYVWSTNDIELATNETTNVLMPLGTNTITLTVTDIYGLTDTNAVTVIVLPPIMPIANGGGDQSIYDSDENGSHIATLDGSASTGGSGAITNWLWTTNNGSTDVKIAEGSHTNAVFPLGSNWVKLTVSCDNGLSDTNTFIVNITDLVPPHADAGTDITVIDTDNNSTESVTLDASGSTNGEGTITNYAWSTNGSVFASGSNAVTNISFPTGTYTVTLKVQDDNALFNSDTISVTVEALTPPTAEAGTNVTVTDTDNNGVESVTLNGSGSTKGTGDITSYTWSTNDGSSNIVIATGTNQIVALPIGTHVITLTAYDEYGLTGTDTVIYVISVPSLTPPSADAGNGTNTWDYRGDGKETVIFDGSDSQQGTGSITNYVWSTNDIVIVQGTNEAHNADLPVGTNVITLTVYDDRGFSDTDMVTNIIRSVSTPTVKVSPNDETEEVALSEKIVLTFSEAIEAGSVTNGGVSVSGQSGNVNGKWKVESNGTTNNCVFTFDPVQDFDYGEKVKITVYSTVKSEKLVAVSETSVTFYTKVSTSLDTISLSKPVITRTGQVQVFGLTETTKVNVYTISGVMVAQELTVQKGQTSWDVKNKEGNPVAPGVYLIQFLDGSSDEKIMKVVVKP